VGRSDVASTLLTLFEQLHEQLCEEIANLNDADLNWAPTAQANSIATIVTHVLGSEAEVLRCVAGVACTRHREGEFGRGPQGLAAVLGRLRSADEPIEELRPAIGAHRLRTLLALPSLPAGERRSGLTWLVGNYGHAREHVGHVQLTKHMRQLTKQVRRDTSTAR